ncbi:hypothetical protein BGZ94_003480 [Podila epigama]|nr:hypothetical protein BGZ94_003480 [Podila epigama]
MTQEAGHPETMANPAKAVTADAIQEPNAKALLKPPVVLIAGAGLAGLLTGLLCERAGIEYFIFERAAKVKPLATRDAGRDPKISYATESADVYSESMDYIGSIDGSSFKEITGYDTYLFARPEFYDLLLSKIPPSRVYMSKKIKSIQQNNEGVMIRCIDGSNYHGDILVGADGAYSAVRQSLYKQLDQQGKLPAEDKEDMSLPYLSLVGTTGPLDPEKYPVLKDHHCHFSTVVADNKPHSWITFTLPNNRIGWRVGIQLDDKVSKDMMFRNSEWGPEANKSLIEQVYNYPMKHGGVMGDLIDATDKDLISKVYLEEKLFQTWHHGRTVLIGDGSMLPNAGQGAVCALQDATILVNCIYEMETVNQKTIEAALAEYRALRFHRAEFQFNMAKTFGKILAGQKWSERLMRKVLFNMPKWAQYRNYVKMATYRPLVSFLPSAQYHKCQSGLSETFSTMRKRTERTAQKK